MSEFDSFVETCIQDARKDGHATVDYDSETEIYNIISNTSFLKKRTKATVIEVNSPEPLWQNCPDCGQKLFRKEKDSKVQRIYLWCKHCKKEVEVNI